MSGILFFSFASCEPWIVHILCLPYYFYNLRISFPLSFYRSVHSSINESCGKYHLMNRSINNYPNHISSLYCSYNLKYDLEMQLEGNAQLCPLLRSTKLRNTKSVNVFKKTFNLYLSSHYQKQNNYLVIGNNDFYLYFCLCLCNLCLSARDLSGRVLHITISHACCLKGRGMGCAKVTHLRLMNSRFCVVCVRTNHFEANLKVSSREVDFKVLRMAI